MHSIYTNQTTNVVSQHLINNKLNSTRENTGLPYLIADNVQIKTANSDTHLNNASNAMRVDVDDIKCKLTSGIFWTLYTADGHCFLHSIITAFNADIPTNEHVDMDSLKRKLKFETSAHSDVYRDFIDATGSTGTYALQKGLWAFPALWTYMSDTLAWSLVQTKMNR